MMHNFRSLAHQLKSSSVQQTLDLQNKRLNSTVFRGSSEPTAVDLGQWLALKFNFEKAIEARAFTSAQTLISGLPHVQVTADSKKHKLQSGPSSSTIETHDHGFNFANESTFSPEIARANHRASFRGIAIRALGIIERYFRAFGRHLIGLLIAPLLFVATSIPAIIASVAVSLSVFITAYGLALSLGGTSVPEEASFAISSVLAGLLTLTLFFAWQTFGYRLGRRKLLRQSPVSTTASLPVLLVAIALSTISSMLSVASLTLVTHRELVQRHVNSDLLRPIEELSRDLEHTASAATAVSSFSETRAAEELSVGGTCGPSIPGNGPIADLRASIALETLSISRTARQLSNEAQSLIVRASWTTSQREINLVFDGAQRLARAVENARIPQRAQVMRAGYSDSGFVRNGRTYACPDTAMIAVLDELLAKAGNINDIPLQVPQVRTAGLSDALALNLKAVPGSNLRSPSSFWLTSDFVPSLVFVIIFELMIAFSAFWFGSRRSLQLSGNQRQNLHRYKWVLNNFLLVTSAGTRRSGNSIDENNKRKTPYGYLLQPEDGNTAVASNVQWIASHYGLNIDPKRQCFKLDNSFKAPKFFIERLRFASGGAVHFTAYPIFSAQVLSNIERDRSEATVVLSVDDTALPEYSGPELHAEVNVTAFSNKIGAK
ncbi:hypothetical protein [Ascidiaceihabitans sp.]|uniref:hypothetical protein n=1 Tax=Ascidiaceihabitans sp. TaxID=1872644 RepID=UPI00329A5E78